MAHGPFADPNTSGSGAEEELLHDTDAYSPSHRASLVLKLPRGRSSRRRDLTLPANKSGQHE